MKVLFGKNRREQKRNADFDDAAGWEAACSQQVPKSSEHENSDKR